MSLSSIEHQHTPLPIDHQLSAIAEAVRSRASVIVKAAPGAGKTTRVPRALLGAVAGRIIVLEPRRLAARVSATRVASELGEPVGKTCGYRVRFAGESSAATRLLFVTEGVFTRMLLDQPELPGVGAVILDEFHERHVHTDIALAMVRRLQATRRPDLRLVVMSATIDTATLERHLEDALLFEVAGRSFPVAIEYVPASGQEDLDSLVRTLPERTSAAVMKILDDERCPGDVLCFLTGVADIERTAMALASAGQRRDFDVLPLYADAPPEAQARIFAPSARRKVILATNVAETSLTIPGVTGVVDGGLAKIAGYAAWSGLPTLDVRRISQASCIQRAGRAGRTAAGVSYRLYSEADFRRRATFTAPDLARLDLTETCLELKAMLKGQGDDDRALDVALPWLDVPPAEALASALETLRMIGALDERERLTPMGERLARLPLHPRLAAVVDAGRAAGHGPLALFAACAIGERLSGATLTEASGADHCDIVALLTRLRAGGGRLAAGETGRIKRLELGFRNLARRLGLDSSWPHPPAPDQRSVFEVSLLAGFPDRLARCHRDEGEARATAKPTRPLYHFCMGRGGTVADSSAARGQDLILALDAAESLQGRGADRSITVYMASAIDEASLALAPGGLLSERLEATWVFDAQRVDIMRRVYYGQIFVAQERLRIGESHRHLVEECLRQNLLESWPKPFADAAPLATYHRRAALLAEHGLADDLPRFEADMLELLLMAMCEGKRSFKEIMERGLGDYLDEQLSYEARSLLDANTPLNILNSAGRKLAVHYDADRPPYVEGYIQDFYGMQRSPEILSGRAPLTVSLLAPNRRPIQVTADLRGFWLTAYPELKKELGRRYPRHFWPDHPEAATPMLHVKRQK